VIVVAAIAVGIFVGLMLGLTGAGGSLFAVPLLALALGMAPAQATGVALGVVAISAWVGVGQRLRTGQIAWWPGTIIAIAGMITAPLGRWLALQMNPLLLTCLFALLVLAVAWRMWHEARVQPDSARIIRGGSGIGDEGSAAICSYSPSGQLEWRARCAAAIFAGGLGIGILSGMLGVGGGFVVVPMLVLILSLNMHQAVATSLWVIALVSASGFAANWGLGPALPWGMLAWIAVGGAIGMVLSGLIAARVAGPRLQQSFALLLLLFTVAQVGQVLWKG